MNLNGSSSYNLPLALPQGTAGMAPKLFLSYDSNSGPGQFGLGWSLAGASAISRINRTTFIDGRPTAAVFDDAVDALALDGSRLVTAPEGAPYLAKSIDDQTRVWRDGQKFVAKTKAGLTLYFGESPNSRIKTSGGQILTWALSRIEDTFGNQIVFLYIQREGDWGIDKAFWTISKGALDQSNLYDETSLRTESFANLVVEYDTSAQIYSARFISGEKTSRSLFATGIVAFVGQTEFRRYEFEYETTGRFGGRRLKSIKEIGADIGSPRVEYPKTEFTYTNFEPRWNKSTSYELPSDFGSYRSLRSGYRLIDLDGDGDRDLLYSAYVDGHSFRRAFKQDAQQWLPNGGLAPPIDFSSESDETDAVFFFDADGDNKPELYSSRLSAGSLQATAHLQDNDTWAEAQGREPPFIVVADGQRLMTTFATLWDAQSRLLTWGAQGDLNSWIIDQGRWQGVPVSGWAEAGMPAQVFDGDFRCDGKPDLATVSANKHTIRFFEKATNSEGGLELKEIATHQSSGDITAAKLLTRGACSSISVATSSTGEVSVVSIGSSGSVEVDTLPLATDQMAKLADIFPLDVVGQGDQDIAILLAADDTKANISVFRFDQSNKSWAHDPVLDYVPSSAGETVDGAYLITVEDIDDDKREDFLLLPAEAGVTTKALVNTGNGFSLVFGFVPPIEFAREEKVGASPQFVDLNADGLTDVAGYHLDKDGKEVINTTQINTKDGWVGVEALKLPKPITHEKGGSAGAFVDFNSDGIADFVYAYGAATDWGAWTIAFDSSGNALRWDPVPGYKLPLEARLSDPENGDMGVRFMDLNADGRVDILVARRELDGSFVRSSFLNSGTGWTVAPAGFLSPVPFVSRNSAEVHYETKVSQGQYYRDLQVSTLDLNGDGLSDLLFRYGHKMLTTGFGIPYTPGKGWCLNKDKVIPGPNPGDPITIEPHPISAATECAGVYLSTGSGWKPSTDDYLPPAKLDLSIQEENASVDIIDVNGDGLPDIVPSRLVAGANQYNAFLNTGKSWIKDAAYSVPLEALSADKKLTGHRIMDLNGDGLLDIAYNRPGPAKGTFLNNGTGWTKASEQFAPPEPFVNDKGEDQGIRFIDVDGNGMPDALRSFRDKRGNLIQSAFLNSGDPTNPQQAIESRADMLKTIANGMGLVTTLDYKSLISPRISAVITAEDFYTPSPISPFPKISHVPTMYAVQQMSFVDTDKSEIATRYQYKGFRFNVPAAAALGFEERTARNFVNNVPSGIEERVEMFQDYFRVGRSKRELAIVDGVTVSEITNEYDLVEHSSTAWPKRLILSSTTTTTRDLNGDQIGSTRQQFAYDSFNNATKTCVEYGDGSRTLTDNSYDNSPDLMAPAVLFLGRLEKAVVSHYRTRTPVACSELMQGLSGVPPDEVVTNTATFAYDIRRNSTGNFDTASTGVLKKEVANSGHPLAVTKSYQHDKFGNTVGETATTADLPARSKSTEYDTLGRFPIAESNALDHKVTYEYSSLLGLATKVTDPNQVENENEYDGFGRLIASTSPTKLKSTDIRKFESGFEVLGRQVALKQVQKVGDLPEITTYFDYQGRTLRTEKLGKSDGVFRKIFQDTKYDARGRAVASSLPFFEGDPVFFGQTEYDNLDRATRTIAPDGGITKAAYAGLITRITDANEKVSVKIVNEKGLTVETVDNAKGSLKFEYGPGDRLLKTIQVDGLELLHGYDQIGNKVMSIDPDLGRWDYRYDGFGEIFWQRDAKGQVTTVSYDLLGRPLQRHMPDKLDQFTYDTAAFGIGKPSAVSSSDGYEEQFAYDNKGRLYRKATRIQGELYSTSVEYDEYDRVVQAHHPGNYVVSSEYDDLGYLSKVRANDPLKPYLTEHKIYWTAGERDQYGRIITEEFGSGVTSTYAYDPLKGNLSRIAAQAADETEITDISLDYDLVGNLLSKDHKTEKKKEDFKYDDLDRLTNWNVNGKTQGRYTYDGAGRMLSKTGMGKYSYDGEGPAHAVKRIAKPDGSEAEYQYDANGNMVFGPKGRFEYYANNSVRLIYKSKDAWSRFSYAPDGSRYFQHYSETRAIGKSGFVTNVLQTISVGAYEQIRDLGGSFIVKPGGFQRHRLYLAAEGGVVAVLEHSTEFEPLANDPKFKAGKEDTPLAIALTTMSVSYLHKDELGSIVKVTNEDGAVVSGYSYDPWGKRVQVAWAAKGKQDFAEGTFRRGFTGHEHLDNLDLIHMNGRVYDPDLARFVSADPTLQFPETGQNYDRYSYVMNNPLAFTDPSGFGLWEAIKKLGRAIAKPFEKIGKWIEKNWRTVVVIAVAAVVSVFTAGIGGAILVGAISGGLNAALYGGDFSDILRGAIIGGASGAAFFGAGELALGVGAETGSFWAETGAGSVGHGVVGGLESEINGGDFWSGFASAAVTKAFASKVADIRSDALQTVAASAIGGTASVVGGGKFENGAITGAYSHLLNDAMHKAKEQSVSQKNQPDYMEDAIYPTWSPIDLAIGAGAFFWRSMVSLYGSFVATTGGLGAWVRFGSSRLPGRLPEGLNKTNWSIRWGSTSRHLQKIGNPRLREWNQTLRQQGGGHWDVVGPGLWSPAVIPPPRTEMAPNQP
ncbi:FG-GAP-like repeat-containing protein (plasmid) [Ensifer adhaerens]|uniref:RHS repeat-associated core domain-containing protein n=1 Tax=Ensifer adhaerens TaxID=106592 RepID=UPI0023A93A85|nr:FG-GAP-like repeat-containing protein [Ensifer adhaerens]WDZ82049.1 FG-GAP-like repeat-containing protein [Ensifer adhaerens]